MYLAREPDQHGKTLFHLRESVRDETGRLVSRQLVELGDDPEAHIVYLDERVFYIAPEIEDALSALDVEYDYQELEEIFWPFIDPDIRETINNFGGLQGRHSLRKNGHKMSYEDFVLTHPFDRRRLYYMKFVQINMDDAVDKPLPVYNMLSGKCRDEIENRITFMEFNLRPWEMRGYLYAIFDIASGFAPRLTRFVPDAQDQKLIDRFFLEELCRLNSDVDWLGDRAEASAQAMHPYLRKYLFLYFDTYFSNRGSWTQRGRKSGDRGEWIPPVPSRHSDHLRTMCLKENEFQNMTEHELTRYFRKKALELHPDKGGDHDVFIAFTMAYQSLLRHKKWHR